MRKVCTLDIDVANEMPMKLQLLVMQDGRKNEQKPNVTMIMRAAEMIMSCECQMLITGNVP